MSRNRRYPARPRGRRPRVTLGNIGEGEVLNGAAAAAFLNDATNGKSNLFATTPSKGESSSRVQRTITSHDRVAECNRPKTMRSTSTSTPTTVNADSNGSRYTTYNVGHTPAATKTRKSDRSSDNMSSTDKERTVSESIDRVEWVIMTNGFKLDEEVEYEIEVVLLGSINNWNQTNPKCLDGITVLVVDTDAIDYHLSTPFVYAMTKAVPIVNRKWLEKSLRKQQFIPSSPFLLKNDGIAETTDMAKLYEVFHPLSLSIRNGIDASAYGGILAGYSFILCKDLDEDEITTREIRQLLIASGAKYLIARKLEETEGKLDKLLIVMSKVAKSEQIEYTNTFTSRGGIRVSSVLVLQILLLQNLSPLQELIHIQERELEKEENNTVVLLEKKLVSVNRTLSKPDRAVEKNRGELGENGMLQIVDIRSQIYVQYKDQDGNLTFRAKAPTKPYAHEEMFGNAGLENCLAWEVTNEAGLPIHRRFFFWFLSRAQLDTFLVTLFDTNPNALNQSILEEWYNERGRFCQKETLPAHDIVTDNMVDVHQRPASKPGAALMCEFGCNTLEATQSEYLRYT